MSRADYDFSEEELRSDVSALSLLDCVDIDMLFDRLRKRDEMEEEERIKQIAEEISQRVYGKAVELLEQSQRNQVMRAAEAYVEERLKEEERNRIL